jgi:polysaccharide biosynthesis/export protein
MSWTTAGIRERNIGGRTSAGNKRRLFRQYATLGLFSCSVLVLGGCGDAAKNIGDYLNLNNSFLNPAEVGRFDMEQPYGIVSPVTWPILDSLAVNDPPDRPWDNSDLPTPADLIPSTAPYVLGPGDVVTVSVFELIVPGQESVQTREINSEGDITLDFVGRVHAAGTTVDMMRDEIVQDLIRSGTMSPPGPHQPGPQVNVDLTEAHKRVFSIIGASAHPGTYNIDSPDFRLLDALALSGDMPTQPGMDWLYIIRPESTNPTSKSPSISSSTGQQNQGGSSSVLSEIANQLQQQPAPGSPVSVPSNAEQEQGLLNQAIQAPSPNTSSPHFVYINGQWVQLGGTSAYGAQTQTPQPAQTPTGPLSYNFANAVGNSQEQPLYIKQRVIRIPIEALRDGDPKYNIVIMPGDTINIPNVDATYFYVMGNVNRPGVYSLSGQKITLKMAIAAAGNLGPVAIPRRCELIRRIGDDQEMIIQVNLQSIFDGEDPDVFIKPDDVLNVGTDAFATFLAVTRNGYQAAYGWGFTYDRNFYITPTILGN